ncbi:Malic enzyme, variant 2 [Balamuthia mandrillaris]
MMMRANKGSCWAASTAAGRSSLFFGGARGLGPLVGSLQQQSTYGTSKEGVSFHLRELPVPMHVEKVGASLIHDPLYNKGTGYPYPERDRLHLRGLVPPRCTSMEDQVRRVKQRYDRLDSNLVKWAYLQNLLDRNETLFYRLLMDNIEDMAPIVYTPTVGEACLAFGSQFRRPRGMYFSSADKGEMSAMIYNWPAKTVDVIVVTDGSRILGLGDLGVHGMGIPIGKLCLYVAGGGIHPARVLPVTLDMGTDNEALLNDPLYLGRQHKRLTGPEYFSLVDEFMNAVKLRYPTALVQFEDFSNNTALKLLEKFRHTHCCFNDDIQGTGAVALSGILTALRAQKKRPSDITKQRIVCLGAGSAGLGVINSLVGAMVEEGLSREEANRNIWLVDKDGLLGHVRTNLQPQQLPFARTDYKNGLSLLETVQQVKPTILLGLSGAPSTFTEEIIREMSKHTNRPIIFPLSNPTKASECSAEQAIHWSDGRAIIATGSPFPPVEYNGQVHVPTQGNNMFIFPGVGLGATICQARKVTDSMFYVAAKTLASLVPEEDVQVGKCYPAIHAIRDVSKAIAIEGLTFAFLFFFLFSLFILTLSLTFYSVSHCV